MSMSDASPDIPWFYPDRLSVVAGESVAIHASAAATPCTLVIRRVGAQTDEVARFEDIAVALHDTPKDADANGCGWPVAFRFAVAAQWRSGYYDLELIDARGHSSHHFVCKKSEGGTGNDGVIVLSTNTYAAYNYWGGANSYAQVEDLLAGRVSAAESTRGALGRLSRLRPYPQNLIAPAEGVPRLVNYTHRDLGERPSPGDVAWSRQQRSSPYDGSACFMRKWEHLFIAWAERAGYELDYLTDHDFVDDAPLLAPYSTALFVGHSEYWSGYQRAEVDRFVDAGGNLAIFSGNTCYWKVRWEDDGDTLIAHKWHGESADPLFASPQTRKDATHLWSHPAFEAPEAALLGLSFLYGGYHRLCMCASRGAGAYTIYDDQHWALAGTDLYYGDQLGVDVPLLGYENDGCPIRFNAQGLPAADGGAGVPQNLQIIGMAPATLAESDRSPFPPMIPPERPETLAQFAYGADDAAAMERLMRGHAVMASFKRGHGEVFNVGTTEWAHGLAAEDPFVARITQNVLARFGLSPKS